MTLLGNWQRQGLLLPLAAVVIGGLIGNSASRLRIAALAQSLVAAILSWLVGLFLVSAVFRFRSPDASEPRGVSIDLGPMLLTILAAAVLGAIMHVAMPWKGPDNPDGWLAMRCEVIGFAGFLAGSIQAAVVCGVEDLSGG